MVTLCSTGQLTDAREALAACKQQHPALFKKLVHIINLTRALQFKYQYVGSLIADEPAGRAFPAMTPQSVLSLYLKEVQSLKEQPDAGLIKELFSRYKGVGYSKLCLLALGKSPESLHGAVVIK